MKIEKLSENQIRCTLTREDLASRNMKLGELVYGSDKAKQLFSEMMQQAFREFGFSANNMPLMIEAVPMSADKLILIITRVDDPEELDSRFARFSPEKGGGEDEASTASLTGLDDIVDLISKLTDIHKSKSDKKNSGNTSSEGTVVLRPKKKKQEEAPASPSGNDEIYKLTRFYLFRDLDTIIRAAHQLDSQYSGPNTLFKNPEDGNYYLILKKADTEANVFNRVCNVLSEYSVQADYTVGMKEFFTEHMTVILPDQAIQSLREL